MRFYKGRYNTGTHTGALWSSTGTRLASVTFANETTSGWQQANFAAPVAIAANTTYVISYLAPRGGYADDQYYSWNTLLSPPLRTVGTAPGVFAYSGSTAFPTGIWNRSNYWVDLVFVAGTVTPPPPPPSTYSLSGTVNGTYAATLRLSGAASKSTGTDSGGNYSFTGLANGAYTVTPSASGFIFSPTSTSVSINSANVGGVNFSSDVIPPPPPPPPPPSHSVDLDWNASISSGVVGYRVYRSQTPGGPYNLITTSAIPTTAYTDNNVSAGLTYYYVATAVDGSNAESGYSNESIATIPTP